MAEKEYIEREAVLMLCQDFIDSHEDGSWRWVNAVTDKDIMNIPSADVVGVVRCKDCEHFRTKPNYCGKLAVDDVEEDFYCCYGEKRANND